MILEIQSFRLRTSQVTWASPNQDKCHIWRIAATSASSKSQISTAFHLMTDEFDFHHSSTAIAVKISVQAQAQINIAKSYFIRQT